MATLAEQSRETRDRARPQKSFGDGLQTAYAERERRKIFGLAFTAANLAAAERKRHGRDSTTEEKADAAQDALVWLYGQEDSSLAAAVDPERGTVSSFDGSRESLRPCREMIAAAGASLDAAHRDRALIDPAAGSGDLLAKSAESRRAGEVAQSQRAHLVDPSVSPVPHPVADAMREAGFWPDDPIRQATIDAICPGLTAQDWLDAGEKGRTPAAIRKRRERGEGTLAVDPRAVLMAEALKADLEPTDAERAERETVGAARLLEASPDGQRPSAASLIDPAWRTTQPYVQPLKVTAPGADK